MRPVFYRGPPFLMIISIHAPIVGCDTGILQDADVPSYFNPRTHRGVRQYPDYSLRHKSQFQSTHPSWGATHILRLLMDNHQISIHAPIVGCDHNKDRKIYDLYNISIHAPIVGCDLSHSVAFTRHLISIHAPIVGCDMFQADFLTMH